ncbi:hypothetical protein KEM56_003364 [Ascosphaera pollenicola]|nr:hypothetical protein KEM56_003364 [Ascosphaera pollenicola]
MAPNTRNHPCKSASPPDKPPRDPSPGSNRVDKNDHDSMEPTDRPKADERDNIIDIDLDNLSSSSSSEDSDATAVTNSNAYDSAEVSDSHDIQESDGNESVGTENQTRHAHQQPPVPIVQNAHQPLPWSNSLRKIVD